MAGTSHTLRLNPRIAELTLTETAAAYRRSSLHPQTWITFPHRADQPQSALDRRDGAAESPGDLLVGVSFHLPQCDGAQFVIRQAGEQVSILFGNLQRE